MTARTSKSSARRHAKVSLSKASASEILSAVKVSLGGTSAEVQYAGAQGGFVGLDQLNVLVPRSLMGRGEIDAVLTGRLAGAGGIRGGL